jgi:hypothetical protein
MFNGLLIKTEFWSLVLFSLVVPFGIFWGFLGTRKISHGMVLGFGVLRAFRPGLRPSKADLRHDQRDAFNGR